MLINVFFLVKNAIEVPCLWTLHMNVVHIRWLMVRFINMYTATCAPCFPAVLVLCFFLQLCLLLLQVVFMFACSAAIHGQDTIHLACVIRRYWMCALHTYNVSAPFQSGGASGIGGNVVHPFSVGWYWIIRVWDHVFRRVCKNSSIGIFKNPIWSPWMPDLIDMAKTLQEVVLHLDSIPRFSCLRTAMNGSQMSFDD